MENRFIPGGLTLLLLAASAVSLEAAPKIDFIKQVLPVIKDRCLDCHRAPYEERGRVKKPKGGLRLDGARWILRGGSGGEVVMKGKPDKSPLYIRVTLPADDEDVMPPKGKLLSKAEAKVIRQWIAEGATFGGWKGDETGTLTKATPKKKGARTAAGTGAAASEEALEKARKSGAVIRQAHAGSPLLSVVFASAAGSITDREFAQLAPIEAFITELDLSRTKITGKTLTRVGQLPKLTYLNLRETATDDQTVAELKNLAYLSYLNLSGTNVSDAGLSHLKDLKKLRTLYFWESKVTNSGVKKLGQALPRTRISR